MDKIKVAIVGCGYFGSLHAEVYRDLPGAELVGVCDTTFKTAQTVAENTGCLAFDNLEKMIAEAKPDMLDICVPDCFHLESVLTAMDHNLHMFVEKPLADNIADCQTILARQAKGYNKKTTVGYICRHEPRNLAAYESIRQGAIGDIMYMTSRRVSPIKGGLHYAPHCHLTTHSGVHDFDLARWFAGSEYKSVYAKGSKGRLIHIGHDTEDAVLSVFTFENGIIYSQENTWSLPEAYPAYIEAQFLIIGTKGSIEIDMRDSGFKIYADSHVEYPDLYYWPSLNKERMGALRNELEDFLACIRDDRKPRVSLEDGYRVTQAAAAVLHSLSSGSEVLVQQ